MRITIEPARSPDVEALLAEGDQFARSLYADEECFLLDVAELEQPGVSVWVARDDPAALTTTGLTMSALGMAALVFPPAATDGAIPELKRLYVRTDARGAGVAAALLAAIETQARDAAASALRLETGTRSAAAIALYARRGYRHIPRFGEYADSVTSVCMELTL